MNLNQFMGNFKLYPIEDDKAEFNYDDNYGLTEKEYIRIVKTFFKQMFLWTDFNNQHLYEINLRMGIHNKFPSTRRQLIDSFVTTIDPLNDIQDAKLKDFFEDMLNKASFENFIDNKTGIGAYESGDKTLYILEFYSLANWDEFTDDELYFISPTLEIGETFIESSKENKIIQILEEFVTLPDINDVIMDKFEKYGYNFKKAVYAIVEEYKK